MSDVTKIKVTLSRIYCYAYLFVSQTTLSYRSSRLVLLSEVRSDLAHKARYPQVPGRAARYLAVSVQKVSQTFPSPIYDTASLSLSLVPRADLQVSKQKVICISPRGGRVSESSIVSQFPEISILHAWDDTWRQVPHDADFDVMRDEAANEQISSRNSVRAECSLGFLLPSEIQNAFYFRVQVKERRIPNLVGCLLLKLRPRVWDTPYVRRDEMNFVYSRGGIRRGVCRVFCLEMPAISNSMGIWLNREQWKHAIVSAIPCQFFLLFFLRFFSEVSDFG